MSASRHRLETRRKAFVRKGRLKCRAVADSFEEASERIFTFTRLDPSQWKPQGQPMRSSASTKRSAEGSGPGTVALRRDRPMLLRTLLASGQIRMRKVDGRETLAHPLGPMAPDLTA